METNNYDVQRANGPRPSLADIAAKAVSTLSKRSTIIAGVFFITATAALVLAVMVPTYRDLVHFQEGAHTALVKRNQDLVRSSVEQAASNTIRILGAAEGAVQNMVTLLSAPGAGASRRTMPVEREFRPGGRYASRLKTLVGYPAGPVTFDLPQVMASKPSELHLLSREWLPFAAAAKRLHSNHPELKWLYMGTGAGSFLVFPASPLIPQGFDPRTRPWYKLARAKKNMLWVRPYFTAGGDDFVLSVAMPVAPTSPFRNAVVGVDVVMTDIVDNLLSTPFCDRCVFYLVNERGEVLGKRGDRTQGTSWKTESKARWLQDDLKQVMPDATASSVVKAALAPVATVRASTPSLSRMPRARLVSAEGAEQAVYTAPIESLGWSLVGTVPANYPGADGEAVLKGVGRVGLDIRILIGVVFLGLGLSLWIFLSEFRKLTRREIHSSLDPALAQFARLADALGKLSIDKNDPTKDAQTLNGSETSLTTEHEGVVAAIRGMQARIATEIQERERRTVFAHVGEMAGTISHEIRNPLQNIRSASERVARAVSEGKLPPAPIGGTGISPNGQLDNPIDSLQFSIQRVDALLTKLRRNYKAASSGTIAPEGHSRSRAALLDKLVQETISEHRVSLPAHIRFIATGFPEAPEVWATLRPAEIQSAFSNILRNAIEAMEGMPTGTLSVKFAADHGKVRIAISDTGRGMTDDIRAHIFEKNFTHGKPNGTGLGLFQAKETVEWHEGRICVESAPDAGSTFTIELARAPSPTWLAQDIRIPNGTPILFVDDDPAALSFWKDRLAAVSGVRADFYSTLEEADAHQITANHVLVLDQHFHGEGKSGLEWLSDLPQQPTTYLCTAAYDDHTVQAEVIRLGLKMIPKPMIHRVKIE